MQLGITLLSNARAVYSARDLGFLLHKHPDHVHTRKTSAGEATIFHREVSDQRGTADRRWKGYDAATFVEGIEHIEPHRLSAVAMPLCADARPNLVVITTPNREYNVLFETMKANRLRHPDQRFEWTRSECEVWANTVTSDTGYTVASAPLETC